MKYKKIFLILFSVVTLSYVSMIHMGAGISINELLVANQYEKVELQDGSIALGDTEQVEAIIFNPPEYRLHGIVYMVPADKSGMIRQEVDILYDSDRDSIRRNVRKVRVFYANGWVNIPATIAAEAALGKSYVEEKANTLEYMSGVALFGANYKVDFLGTWE